VATIAGIEATATGPTSARWTGAPAAAFRAPRSSVTDSDGCEVWRLRLLPPADVDLSVVESLRSWRRAVGPSARTSRGFLEEMRIGVVFPFSPGPWPLDVALWDLAARRAGLPLWRFLGGAGVVPAYASRPRWTRRKYLGGRHPCARRGHRSEVHAWGDPSETARCYGAARPRTPTSRSHDAEGVYDRREALAVARVGGAGLPLAGAAPDSISRLSPSCSPVSTCRSACRLCHVGRAPVRRGAARPPWSAARAELTCTLGITWMKLMRLAAGVRPGPRAGELRTRRASSPHCTSCSRSTT
jgi:hypothetical protein